MPAAPVCLLNTASHAGSYGWRPADNVRASHYLAEVCVLDVLEETSPGVRVARSRLREQLLCAVLTRERALRSFSALTIAIVFRFDHN